MTLPTAALPALHCPKCAGPMATFERSGIHVDQCRECRGVFLDRGELERLIDLEAEAMAAAQATTMRSAAAPPLAPGPAPAWGPPAGAYERRDRDWDDDDDDDRRRHPESARGGDRYDRGFDPRYGNRDRSRRRGFLGELFEGFGD